MANTLPRQSVSFYWSLGLHCVGKNEFLLPEIQPATAQITNPTNMAKDQWFIFFPLHFWMQTLWFRIYSLHQSCGTHSGCMKCYCMIQTTHFWQNIKAYCFFCSTFASLPLLLCIFFLCHAWTAFKQEQDNVGEWCAKDGTALQYMMLMRLFSGISLLTYQRGRHSGNGCTARIGEKQEATSH